MYVTQGNFLKQFKKNHHTQSLFQVTKGKKNNLTDFSLSISRIFKPNILAIFKILDSSFFLVMFAIQPFWRGSRQTNQHNNRQTNQDKNRQTNQHKNRQTNQHKNRQTNQHYNRETNQHKTDKQTSMHKNRQKTSIKQTKNQQKTDKKPA